MISCIFIQILCTTFVIIILNPDYVLGVRYEHTLEEIELTRRAVIQQPKCETNWTQVFVHSAARTSGKYYDRRKATREGWALEARKYRFNVVFVLALPRDQSTQTDIIIESNRFGDILQFDFIDDYHNLTLKAIGILNWISNNCLSADYVLKTDDDILVNSQRLRQKIDDKAFESGITGKMFGHSIPVRDINNKWFVPKELYDKNYYPPYLAGPAYIMSTDIIQKLYNSAINNSNILYIDDLYLTGIIPQKSNVDIHRSDEFFLTESDTELCSIDVCKLYTICTFHGCNRSVNQTIQFWNLWKNTTRDSCDNFFVKLHKSTTIAIIVYIIAALLLFAFISAIIAMICQYLSNDRKVKWHKVNTNTNI